MLKTLRKQLGLSVNDLADMIETNERTVRRWEYGEPETPKAVLWLLAVMVSLKSGNILGTAMLRAREILKE